MNTAKKLEQIKTRCGSWAQVARELGITYRYVVLLRNGQKPGRFLTQIIDQKIEKKE